MHSIVAVTIVAVLAFLAANVSPAYALQADPMTTAENQGTIEQYLLSILDGTPAVPAGTNPATGLAYTSADTIGGLTAAEEAAAVLPDLPLVGTVLIGGATLYTSYKLFSPLGNVIARSIFGDSSVNSSGFTTTNPEWISVCNSGCKTSGASVSGLCGGANCVQSPACTTCNTAATAQANGSVISGVSDGWFLSCTGGPTIPCAGCTAQGIASGSGTHCSLVSAAQQAVMTEMHTDLHAGSYIYVENNAAAPGWCGSASVAGDCFTIVRTDGQLRGQVTYKDGATGGPAPYGSANAQVNETGKYTIPTTVSGSAATNAEETCAGFNGAVAGTAQQEACRAELNQTVDPTWRSTGEGTTGAGSSVTVLNQGASGSAFTFELPEPSPDDTIDTYIEKLRTLGYVGNFTVIDDPMPYPNGSYAARLVPTSVTSVQIGTATVIDVYDGTTGNRNTWPRTSSATVVTPSTDTSITVGGVPSSYNPLSHGATTSTETGATAAPSGAGGSCNCPSLDMSPLESVTYGSKFPFGVFTWFSTIFGTIPSTGTAISFDLNKTPNPADGSYNITLSGGNLWVGTIRPIAWPIIEFLFVAGAAAVLAYKILGMGQPDD